MPTLSHFWIKRMMRRVADPMFQEANQPLLADFVEERSDVGVQYPVHLRALDPDNERIQCVVRAAPGLRLRIHTEEIHPRKSSS